MIQLSRTEENYLKAIYTLNADEENMASTSAIAKKLNTSSASVSDMLKKLSDKKLIKYKKYQAAQLTSKGNSQAILIIRKHRLWEFFLVEKLNFGWDEVHDLAEELEHIKSVPLIDRLERFLEMPQFDPHGDPIPNKAGEFPQENRLSLNQLKPEVWSTVVGVKTHSQDFLNYLDKLGISLGSELLIKQINAFDQSIDLIHQSQKLSLSNEFAKNIYVEIK